VITIANLFAKSLCPYRLALKQFNSLSAKSRSEINRLLNKYDEIRRKKINNNETEDAWFTCVMVDAHIIAAEYDIDPLTVIMCPQAPCKLNEVIIVNG
jgi:hypothetical protein